MVTNATYGRMRIGRCVDANLGHLGCQGDVLGVVDRHCSGRQRCELRVSHPDMILEGAALYHQTDDGLIPWRQRPEHFKRNCIARIPPLTFEEPQS